MKSFCCYYCNFETDDEDLYLQHGVTKHLNKPMFPNEAEMRRYQLEPKNLRWEKPFGTEEEARERLARWAEKRMKEEHEKAKEPKQTKTYSYTEGYTFTRTTLDDYGD